MSGAESSSTNPFYSSGKLPTLPFKGPFTLADHYGNKIGGKHRRRYLKRRYTKKYNRRTRQKNNNKTRNKRTIRKSYQRRK